MIENVLRLRPRKAKNGESKYMPHQGRREMLRRRLGGFHHHRRMMKEREAYITKYGPDTTP